MRRIAFVFAPLVLAGLAFACENDPENGPPPTIDIPEGGLTDLARPEQDIPLPTSVTVTVVGRTGPKAGVAIVFHDASGAVLETKTTGADGKATRPEGSAMATALLSAGARRHLVTWTGLTGGDDLTVSDVADTALLGTYDVTHPYFFADAGPFGASDYTAFVGDCTGFTTGLTVTVNVTADCVAPSGNAVLFRADEVTRTGDIGLGYSFAKNVAPPVDGGALAVATSNWEHAAPFSVDLLGKPAIGASASLFEIAGPTAIQNFSAFSLNPNPASFRTAKGFADAIVALASVRTATDGSFNVLGERFAPAAGLTSKTFDYAQHLDEVSNATIDAMDSRRPVLAWTAPPSIATATKGGVAEMKIPTASRALVTWSFVVPPGATNVKAPALPSPSADPWLPLGDASSIDFRDPGITFVDAAAIASYAQFRARAGVVFAPGATSLFSLLPNGTFRITRYFEPPPS